MKQKLIAQFDEAELRLEKVVCLALQPYLALSDEAEQMLEYFEDVVKETGINYKLDEEFDPDAVNDLAEDLRMHGFTNYFVQISKALDGWGLSTSRWFYVDTIDKAVELAIAHEWITVAALTKGAK